MHFIFLEFLCFGRNSCGAHVGIGFIKCFQHSISEIPGSLPKQGIGIVLEERGTFRNKQLGKGEM